MNCIGPPKKSLVRADKAEESSSDGPLCKTLRGNFQHVVRDVMPEMLLTSARSSIVMLFVSMCSIYAGEHGPCMLLVGLLSCTTNLCSNDKLCSAGRVAKNDKLTM